MGGMLFFAKRAIRNGKNWEQTGLLPIRCMPLRPLTLRSTPFR